MGHVSSRPARLTLAAFLPILILWLAFAGGAHAALPTNGTINQPAPASTEWQGAPFTSAQATGNPQACPPMQPNTFCDHFQLTTSAAGPVRVVATWPCTDGSSTCAGSFCNTAGGCVTDPALADFDILVCDDSMLDAGELDPIFGPPADNCVGGTEIAFFSTNRVGFEGGVFQADAGKTYDIRVIPIFVDTVSDYHGCAEYTNAAGTQATFCAPNPVVIPPPVAASEFLAGCPAEASVTPLERQVDGGGQIPSTVPNKKAPFSINARRHRSGDGKTHFKGKLNYHDDGNLNFKSENATCATFTDGTNTSDSDHSTTFRGSVEVRGFGKVKMDSQSGHDAWQRVCYKAIGQDWGQPGAGKDRFHIELYAFDPALQTCSSVPMHANDNVLTDGNIKYKFRPEGKDDD
jgi:hypothetical protein